MFNNADDASKWIAILESLIPPLADIYLQTPDKPAQTITHTFFTGPLDALFDDSLDLVMKFKPFYGAMVITNCSN